MSMNTRHLLTATTILALIALLSSSAMAQEGRASVKAELGARLALDDWADISGPGFGGTLGFHYHVTPELELLVRAGYFAGLPKTTDQFFGFSGKVKTNELPILFGARYHLPSNGAAGPLWAGLELGMSQISYRAWIEDSDGDRDFFTDDQELEPTLVLGGGYDLGQVEPHVAVHWIPLDGDDLVAVVLTLGFDLTSF